MTALDKAGLVGLAERVEALADESQLVRLLEPVAGLLWKDAYLGWARFLELANVKAWESAAMTLVPTRWKLRQMNFSAPCADDRKWHLNLHGGSEGQDCFVGRGSTKELALTAAALRALSAGQP